MSTRKKRHLIAGTIIGGLLLAATTQTGNSFALSNTSSPTTGSATTTSQQVAPQTNDSSTSTGNTPNTASTPSTTSGANSVADGSTATQTANSTAGVTSGSNTLTPTATPITQSQPNSPSGADNTSNDPTNALANNTTAKNKVKSSAQTGDATVKHTTTGGNATSGNASVTTTLVNSVASSSNINSGNLQTFNYNINGNQNGNVVVNPNNLLATSNSTSIPTTPADCIPTGSTTVQNNSTINNLVNLLAKTGSAKVNDNGVGGNATSGNATTEANIVNMIQDLVSNKGAFLGVVNINGNLKGNIELPTSTVNALLTPTQTGDTTSKSTSATNNGIVNNNITLTALTGTAAVTNNGVGGNATSGNASTVLNSCNVINSNIVGGNLLLVFVNVLGHWYGALMSEPTGETTATLGGGITQDIVAPLTSQTSVSNNSTINNNINLTSVSGNATVANNGIGGNATTGNATAIADITNILGSHINLSGWLGILIINVYGSWDGSLVIQPANTTTNQSVGGNNGTHALRQTVLTVSSHHSKPVIGDGYSYTVVNPPQSFDAGQYDLASAHVLGASTLHVGSDLGSSVRQVASTNHKAQPVKRVTADFILAGIGIALAITGGISRYFVNRRNSSGSM